MPQPKDKTKVKEWKENGEATLQGRRCCMRTECGRGHTPWNKGTKGLTKANKTSFKKGNKPANYQGGYKLCKDGIYVRVGNKTYKYGNLEVGKYEQLARIKYRKAFGKFDKKLIIFHKDCDKMNNEIDNLELISRAELLKRNAKPTKKPCSICGKEFLAKLKTHKTCSKKCYEENCKLIQRKSQAKIRAKRKAERLRVLNNTNTYTLSQQPL